MENRGKDSDSLGPGTHKRRARMVPDDESRVEAEEGRQDGEQNGDEEMVAAATA